MKNKCISILIATEIAMCSSCFAGWENIRLALRSAGEPPQTYSDLERIPELRQLLQETNKGVFVAMTCQPKDPLVGIAGFLVIRERYSAFDAYTTAFRLVVFAESAAELTFVPVYKHLEIPPQQQVFDTVLNTYGNFIPRSDHTIAVLMDLLPYESLKAWSTNNDPATLLPDWRGAVIERLLREETARGEVPAPSLTKALMQLQNIPGTCQLTYLLYSDPKAKGFVETLNQALSDGGLDSVKLAVLLMGRPAVLTPMINFENLTLSPDRRNMIEKALRRRKGVTH